MHVRLSTRVQLAGALAAMVAAVPSAWAGGAGLGGVAVLHVGHNVHGGTRGLAGGGLGVDSRGLPPLSGIIHERPGMRRYFSPYGHTNTALVPSSYGVDGRGRSGHVTTAFSSGRGAFGSPGPVLPAMLPYTARQTGFVMHGRERFDRGGVRDRFRFATGAGPLGYGAVGGDVGIGAYGGADGGVVAPGGAGTFGPGAPYEMGGGYAGGDADGDHYASETPLAARFAEGPLGPSPGWPYGPDDRYTNAASQDIGRGPRIITVSRGSRPDCGCAPHLYSQPVIYRYGVGTAY